MIDGQRLIACRDQPIKGVSCQTAGSHSTQRETFQRIASVGPTWQVYDRDGTRSAYKSWPGKAEGAIFSIAERTNTHGDTVHFKRMCDGEDACYLKEIEYQDSADPAKHTRIRFFYEKRPDPITFGMGSDLLETRFRLLSIKVSTHGKTRSALALRYAKPEATRGGAASRLEGVTRYGTDAAFDSAGKIIGGTALPAESFSWQKDDKQDITPGRAVPSGDVGPEVVNGGGPGYADSIGNTTLLFDHYAGEQQWLTADVNGDGRDDVVTVDAGHEYRFQPRRETLGLQVRLSDGKGGFVESNQSTTWPVAGGVKPRTTVFVPKFRLLTGDVNADGLVDVVNVWWDESTGSGRVLVRAALGTPSGILSQQGTATTGLTKWSDRARWFLGDQDGDGLADLIGVQGANGDDVNGYANAELLVARSDGRRFSSLDTTSTKWTYKHLDDAFWFVGDVDGDERVDVLSVESKVSTTRPTAGLRVALSKGMGRFTMLTQPTNVQLSVFPFFAGQIDPAYRATDQAGELVHAGDFDGDGRTDLLLVQPIKDGRGHWELHFTSAFSRHDGAFELVDNTTDLSPQWLNSYQRWQGRLTRSQSPYRWMTTDVDGDGRSDLLLGGPEEWHDPTTNILQKVLSRGDGSWTVGETEFTSWPFSGLQVTFGGDLNGDGRGDAVAALQDHGKVSVAARMSRNTVTDLQRGNIADVTGDGRPDWVYPMFTNPGLIVSTAISDPRAVNGVRMVRRPVAGLENFAQSDMRRWVTADFGSPGRGPDGRADLLHLSYDDHYKAFHYTLLLSTGDGNYVSIDGVAGSAPEDDPDVRKWIPVDANGDGNTDLVKVKRASGRAVTTMTLLANGLGGWQKVSGKEIAVPWPLVGASHFQPTDVDGDGWNDLVHVSVQTDPTYIRRESVLSLHSNGDGTWTAEPKYMLPSTQRGAVGGWRPAELNGDGRFDLVRLRYDKPSATQPGITAVDRLLSNGVKGFKASSVNIGVSDYSPGWNAVDENGDGCDDLSWINGGWQANHGFSFMRRVVNTCADLKPERTKLTGGSDDVPTVGWWPAAGTRPGTQHLLRMLPGESGPELATIPFGSAPRLIEQAHSGLGRQITLGYTTSAGAQDNLPPGMTAVVVDRRTVSSGSAGGFGTTYYSYAGLRWSYPLEQPLGFERMTASENRRQMEMTFSQTPGCAGAVKQHTVRSPAGKVLLAENTLYEDASETTAPPWTCTPGLQIRLECDALPNCRQIRGRLAYDKFGNMTVLEEDGEFVDDDMDGADDLTGDNRRQLTDYFPNTGAYIVSRPARIRTEAPDQTLVADQRLVYDHNSSYLEAATIGDVRVSSAYESHLGKFLNTTYLTDRHGNIKEQTDPTGRTTKTIWDRTYARFPEHVCNKLWCTDTVWDTVLGLPTSTTDPNKLPTILHWDQLGRHKRTDFPDGGCVAHGYDDWGKLLLQRLTERRCVLAGGHGNGGYITRAFYFDGLHRVWRDDRSGGLTRHRSFLNDSLLPYSDVPWHDYDKPAEAVATYGYDALDRPTVTIHGDRSTNQHTYGPGVTTETDENNRSTRRYTDGLGRVTRVEEGGTGAPPIITTLHYDLLDQLLESRNQDSDITSYRTIGSLGWVWQDCDPDRHCVDRTFDNAGRVKTQTNAAGQRIVYGYETLGRLVSKTYHDDHGAIVDKSIWTYDVDPTTKKTNGYSKGQVTQTLRTSSSAREIRFYDKMGRLTQQQVCVPNPHTMPFSTRSPCIATETTWDPAGRIAHIRYPDRSGRLTGQSEQVDYTYDEAGRTRSVGNYATDLRYTPSDQLNHLTYGNDVAEDIGYNPRRGWIQQIDASGMAGNFPTDSLGYPRDAGGRITGEDRMKPGPMNYQKRYTRNGIFFGDAYGRLDIESARGAVETYGFDALGRPSSRSKVGDYVYGDPQHPNAVTAVGNRKYTYDAAGRMTSSPNTTAHTWDADGNLTGFTTTKQGAINYGYDADGHRVFKDIPGISSRRIFAGPLVEIDEFEEPIRSYMLGDRLIARTHWSWWSEGDPAGKLGVLYYHSDVRGSAWLITLANGRPLQWYDYEPYGTAHFLQQGLDEDRKFTGARQDEDSGFIHLGARDYDPVSGRFISPDSIVPDPQRSAAYDRYAYGYYDPVNTSDVSGHSPTDLNRTRDLLRVTSPVTASTSPRRARLLDQELQPPSLIDREYLSEQERTGPATVNSYGPLLTLGFGISAAAQIYVGPEVGAYCVFDTAANSGIMITFGWRTGSGGGASLGFSGFGYWNATVPEVSGLGYSFGVDTPKVSGAWNVSCQDPRCNEYRSGFSISGLSIGALTGAYTSTSYSFIFRYPAENALSREVEEGRQHWNKGEYLYTPRSLSGIMGHRY